MTLADIQAEYEALKALDAERVPGLWYHGCKGTLEQIFTRHEKELIAIIYSGTTQMANTRFLSAAPRMMALIEALMQENACLKSEIEELHCK